MRSQGRVIFCPYYKMREFMHRMESQQQRRTFATVHVPLLRLVATVSVVSTKETDLKGAAGRQTASKKVTDAMVDSSKRSVSMILIQNLQCLIRV